MVIEYYEVKFVKPEKNKVDIDLNIKNLLSGIFSKEYRLIKKWKARLRSAIESDLFGEDELLHLISECQVSTEEKQIAIILIENKEYWFKY